jgi:hypothetical protein
MLSGINQLVMGDKRCVSWRKRDDQAGNSLAGVIAVPGLACLCPLSTQRCCCCRPCSVNLLLAATRSLCTHLYVLGPDLHYCTCRQLRFSYCGSASNMYFAVPQKQAEA